MRIQIKDDTHTVVLTGNGRWAKGVDLDDAKKTYREFGGRLSAGYVVAEFGKGSEFTGVDGFGYTHYLGTEPTMTEIGTNGHVVTA